MPPTAKNPLKEDWFQPGKEVEIEAEACEGEGRSDVEGFQGSWRRARVADLNGPVLSISHEVTVVLHVTQNMYADDDDRKPVFEDPEVDGYATEADDDDDDGGEGDEDDDDDENEPNTTASRTWRVALDRMRPYRPFTALPREDASAFEVGDRVQYKDGADECLTWKAYVRKVFADGLWIYVPGSDGWSRHEHHCLVASETSPALDIRHDVVGYDNPVVKRVFPIDRHLRRDQQWDSLRGEWLPEPFPRCFYAPPTPSVSPGPIEMYPDEVWYQIFTAKSEQSKKRAAAAPKAGGEGGKKKAKAATASGSATPPNHAVAAVRKAPAAAGQKGFSARRPWKYASGGSLEEENRIRDVLKRSQEELGWLEECPDDSAMADFLVGFMRCVVLPEDGPGGQVARHPLLAGLADDFGQMELALERAFVDES